ncbi:class I SAM-dependent methyltransferase [Knoellia sp. p5-6-4]|uniref:class I SAM-dependent methyltransferase n=1 Tax=unclassified Knoellia TaxID=2618719 RepID=UPI0023DB20A5|nr:class I SAM-dependent methyltransferase [Knoellia sp. p5-6-4]MDF2145866.1 class I SAM-dependent methyltransferase [Knoellia sp. p5-6-4]
MPGGGPGRGAGARLAVPERIRYAVGGLSLHPDSRVLEVGGGNGVAAALMLPVLGAGAGFLLGIDRSPTATAAASARNADAVRAGTAVFVTAELPDLDPAAHGRFDRVLGVNVNVFWTESAARELAVLERVLDADGELHLVHQPPSVARRTPVLAALVANLERAGWRADVDVPDGEPPLLRVVARPPGEVSEWPVGGWTRGGRR